MAKSLSLEEVKNYLVNEQHGLINEIFNAINTHCFYITIDKAHENNSNNKLSTNNVLLANFIRNGYVSQQFITIIRLIDSDPHSISLIRMINELLELKLTEITNNDDLLDLNINHIKTLRELKDSLENNKSLKKIKRDRNKKIAHLDKKHFGIKISSEINDIESSLIVIAYVAKELNYVVSQTISHFSYISEPRNMFKALDLPFFFPKEIEELTKYFYESQTKIQEKISLENSVSKINC